MAAGEQIRLCDGTDCPRFATGEVWETVVVPHWRRPNNSGTHTCFEPTRKVYFCADHQEIATVFHK